MELNEIKNISFYKSIKDTAAAVQCADLDMIIRAIKNNANIQSITEAVRAETDKDKKRALKNNLPAVTLSAEFDGAHKAENVVALSGLMQIDIDELPSGETWETMREKIASDPFVLLSFRSPSDKIKAVVRYDTTGAEQLTTAEKIERHRRYFYALDEYFKNTYNVQLDANTKDVSRLCFLSHDDAPHINTAADVWRVLADAPRPKQPPREVACWDNNDYAQAAQIVAMCEQQGINIVGDYEGWKNAAFSLADTLGESGRDLFIRLSALDFGKYDRAKTEAFYTQICKDTRGAHTIGTLKKLFADNGGHYEREQVPRATPRRQAPQADTPHADTAREALDVDICATFEGDREEWLNAPPPVVSGFSFAFEGERVNITLPADGISLFCAPTGHGKTTIALNMALNMARADSTKVFYYLTSEELTRSLRLKFANMAINESAELRGNFADTIESIKQIDAYGERVREVYREFIECGRVRFVNICGRTSAEICEQLAAADNVGAIFVDYLQKVQADGFTKHTDRAQALQVVMEDFNSLSGARGVPVVCLSQFNRTATSPLSLNLSALSQSSALEWNAQLIVFIWNCYKPLKTDPKDAAALMALCGKGGEIIQGDGGIAWRDRDRFWLYVAKNRTGESEQSGYLKFIAHSGRVVPLDYDGDKPFAGITPNSGAFDAQSAGAFDAANGGGLSYDEESEDENDFNNIPF